MQKEIKFSDKSLLKYYKSKQQHWTQLRKFEYNRIKKFLETADFKSLGIKHPRDSTFKVMQNKIKEFTRKHHVDFQVNEIIYLALNKNKKNLVNELFCPECGKRTRFKKFHCGFTRFCDTGCYYHSDVVKNKTIETCQDRYGYDNVSQFPKFKEKMRKKNLEHSKETSIRKKQEWANRSELEKQIIQKRKERTCIKRYGCKTPFDSPECKKKAEDTLEKKYGVRNASQSEEIKQKKIKNALEKIGVEHHTQLPDWPERYEKGCLRTLGVANPYLLPEIRDKIKKTNLEKFNAPNYMQSEQVISDNYAKFGADWWINSDEAKEHFKSKYGVDHPSKSEQVLAKIRQTTKDRYGKEYYTQTKEYLEKQYKTKKKNNSFHVSHQEDYLYQQLRKYFIVKRQYKSKEYPFNCDFYIPKLNLYLELNASWVHGFMPFNKRKSFCKEQLLHWTEKAKTSNYYKVAIEVWTQRDVLKFKTAKKNRLNYIAFYTLKEALSWLKQFSPIFLTKQKYC